MKDDHESHEISGNGIFCGFIDKQKTGGGVCVCVCGGYVRMCVLFFFHNGAVCLLPILSGVIPSVATWDQCLPPSYNLALSAMTGLLRQVGEGSRQRERRRLRQRETERESEKEEREGEIERETQRESDRE